MEPKLKYLLFFMSKQRTLVKFGVICNSFCGFLVSNQFEKNITFVVSCCLCWKIYKNVGLNKSRQWKTLLGESGHQIFFSSWRFHSLYLLIKLDYKLQYLIQAHFFKRASHQKGNNMYFRCRTWSWLLCCYIFVQLKWPQMSWEFNY